MRRGRKATGLFIEKAGLPVTVQCSPVFLFFGEKSKNGVANGIGEKEVISGCSGLGGEASFVYVAIRKVQDIFVFQSKI